MCLIASAHLPGFLPFDFYSSSSSWPVCLSGLVCVFAVFTSVLTGTTRLSTHTQNTLELHNGWASLIPPPATNHFFVFLPWEKLSCVRIHPDASIHTQITENIPLSGHNKAWVSALLFISTTELSICLILWIGGMDTSPIHPSLC